MEDTTGNIVLTDATHITLMPGYYAISYQVSAILVDISYMQITPAYNGRAHLEYGIYFKTGTERTTALSLYFNSPTTGQEGTATMVIFKLDRDV